MKTAIEFLNGKDEFVKFRMNKIKTNCDRVNDMTMTMLNSTKLTQEELLELKYAVKRLEQDVTILRKWFYSCLEMEDDCYKNE